MWSTLWSLTDLSFHSQQLLSVSFIVIKTPMGRVSSQRLFCIGLSSCVNTTKNRIHICDGIWKPIGRYTNIIYQNYDKYEDEYLSPWITSMVNNSKSSKNGANYIKRFSWTMMDEVRNSFLERLTYILAIIEISWLYCRRVLRLELFRKQSVQQQARRSRENIQKERNVLLPIKNEQTIILTHPLLPYCLCTTLNYSHITAAW